MRGPEPLTYPEDSMSIRDIRTSLSLGEFGALSAASPISIARQLHGGRDTVTNTYEINGRMKVT